MTGLPHEIGSLSNFQQKIRKRKEMNPNKTYWKTKTVEGRENTPCPAGLFPEDDHLWAKTVSALSVHPFGRGPSHSSTCSSSVVSALQRQKTVSTADCYLTVSPLVKHCWELGTNSQLLLPWSSAVATSPLPLFHSCPIQNLEP